MSARTHSSIALYGIVAAATAALLAPLLALAYFATADGAEQLAVGTVAVWALPARELVGGLVTWSGADRVYATYTQVIALLFPAVLLTALVARSRRPAPRMRPERIGWWIALTGYGLFASGLLLTAVMLIPGDTSGPLVDLGFMALMVPGLLLSMIGSTTLGVVFLRSGHRPRLTAWLLALSFPLLVAGSVLLGHNGLGLVPLFVAWAATGWRLRAAGGTLEAGPVGAVPAPHATALLGAMRLVVPLLTIMLVATGCGAGGVEEAPAEAATIPKEEAIARVTDRCAQVNEAFAEIDLEEEPGRVADELEGFVADVRALPAPADGQESFDALVSALESSAEAWRAVADAPEGERSEALGAAFGSFAPAEDAAVDFGVGPLQECGRETAEIDPDAVRVEIAAREYEFDVPATVTGGSVALVLHNEGAERHHIVVVRFKGEETLEEVLAAEQAGEDPQQFVEDVGGTPAAAPGEEVALPAMLSAGRYGMLCFIAAADGEPHAVKGMHAEFTVEDA